jgi:hypothetical protein
MEEVDLGFAGKTLKAGPFPEFSLRILRCGGLIEHLNKEDSRR